MKTIKKLISLSLITIMATFANGQQQQFVIEGTIQAKTKGFIYLSYSDDNGDSKLDSSMILKGHFLFKGKLGHPVEATIMIGRNEEWFDKEVVKYIVPGKMKLLLYDNAFAERAVLTGSYVQAQADILDTMKEEVMKQFRPLKEVNDKATDLYSKAKRAKKDSAVLTPLYKEMIVSEDALEPFNKEITRIEKVFMDRYPDSYVTLQY